MERAALADENAGLIIGKYNRRILLSMLDSAADHSEVDERKLEGLTSCLQRYLDRYMEQKEGHKWIILASLFNALVLEVPIHPIEVTNIRRVNGEYICPCRDESEDSVCLYCVCRGAGRDEG